MAVSATHDPANPAELRACLASDGRPLYIIGAIARIHPVLLSAYIRGHRPIPADALSRLLAAVSASEPESR